MFLAVKTGLPHDKNETHTQLNLTVRHSYLISNHAPEKEESRWSEKRIQAAEDV